MKPYLDLLQDVLENGTRKEDRTGTGTLSVFGRQVRYDLSKGFPAVTTKKLFWRGVVGELLWILSGSTNVKPLQEQGIHIWDEWADSFGELGPVYGAQWRSWEGIHPDLGEVTHDQIKYLIGQLKFHPDSRRHIVSAWNVTQIGSMALPPCHLLFQFYVEPLHHDVRFATFKRRNPSMVLRGEHLAQHEIAAWTKTMDEAGVPKGKLSLQLYQRSADLFLGVPFNIASYALLTHLIAQVCNLEVGEFIHTLGDAHLYLNHLDQVKEQLSREPLPLPRLWLNPEVKDIDDFMMIDCLLEGYVHHPAIVGEVSV